MSHPQAGVPLFSTRGHSSLFQSNLIMNCISQNPLLRLIMLHYFQLCLIILLTAFISPVFFSHSLQSRVCMFFDSLPVFWIFFFSFFFVFWISPPLFPVFSAHVFDPLTGLWFWLVQSFKSTESIASQNVSKRVKRHTLVTPFYKHSPTHWKCFIKK